jgi:hypothetical protein
VKGIAMKSEILLPGLTSQGGEKSGGGGDE